jgi:PAS domain S-box-containing protein
MTHAAIDPKSVETALADPAFSPLAGGPILVAGGAPARVLYASAPALALFQSRDANALTGRLFNGAEPGARRLAELALTLEPGATRVERLRFYVGGASEALTFQCKRLAGDQPLFIAAPLGVRAALLKASDAPAASAGLTPATSTATARPGNVRFVWKTDAEARLTHFDEAGARALGYAHGDLIGASLLELAGDPGFDPDGRLCAALMARETWRGVEVEWPIAGGGSFAPVLMGALPTFDAARAFTGFSGFGVIHMDRVQQRPAINDELAADMAEESAGEAPDAVAADLEEIARLINARADTDVPPADGVDDDLAGDDLFMDSGDGPDLTDGAREAASTPAAFNAPNVVALNAWKNGATPPSPAPQAPEPPAPAPAPAPAAETQRRALPGDEFPMADGEEEELVRLTPAERHAFREIARALGARIEDAEKRRARRDERKTEERRADERRIADVSDNEGAAGEPPRHAASANDPPAIASSPSTAEAVRRLLDRIDTGLMVCREGEAVFLNKTLLDTLGYDSFETFAAAGGVARMFRGRTPESASSGGAVPVARADGETIALEGRLTTIDWDGAPAMLTTFRRPADTDLSTRLRAVELDLRAKEAEGRELTAILDTATDGVAILDHDGRILGLNRSAEALFGYEQNEVAGESFTILFATESHPAAIDYLTGLKTNGVRSVLNDGRDVMGRARQGGTIPIFMTIGRVGSDAHSKFCVVMRDMTQWKNAERELKDARRDAEQASALKSDFLAKISHEIRTPLNAILGFAEVILEERFGPVGNERYKDYLKDIHASGTHVMSLVNDLLDLSKIEAGKLELSFASVDANRIINECVSMMQAQAIRERVIIRLSLAPRFPNIVADERALRQIVLNLLSNAVKFNQPGGQVIVSTALTDAGSAVIRVRDNGVGMNDKEVETALEPFRQIQTSRQTTGTGLGLPLTKALVEANRAAFVIRSRKGEGTLVEVSFPSTRVLAE